MTPGELLTMLDAGLGLIAIVQLRLAMVELRAVSSRVAHVEAVVGIKPAPASAAA